MSSETLAGLVRAAAGLVAYTAPPVDGRDQPRRLRLGTQIGARPVTGTADRETHGAQLHPETVAAYIAKYATKAAGDLPTDQGGGNGHLRRLQATLRQLAARASFAALAAVEQSYRGWVDGWTCSASAATWSEPAGARRGYAT